MFRKSLGILFLFLTLVGLYNCARRGAPTGGPKDETPPEMLRADPPNMSTDFNTNRIRLYFDELVKLKDVQEQLIVSPPLKYDPQLSPQGGANKYIDILLRDTLLENTTYTFNFGQSIVDNNEENPLSFFTYVFSTGSYLDSLELAGVITDAFNKEADDFVSVLLYKIDSSYTDSTVYKRPPDYMTNTLDSAIVFRLQNLKEGQYALFGLKDAAKNNIFDQASDKIGFVKDTITLPTDSIYRLNLFREIPDYSAAVPSLAASNRIGFGYYGPGERSEIIPLSILPDTVRTKVTKTYEKDTLDFWFTPFEMDSLIFAVRNEQAQAVDTFVVKNRKVGRDSLRISPNQTGDLDFGSPFSLRTNTPLAASDTSKIKMFVQDSIPYAFIVVQDSAKNQIVFDFEKKPETNYTFTLLPGAITDFFGTSHDTLTYGLRSKVASEYGNLTINLKGKSLRYPIIVQLTDKKGELVREIYSTKEEDYVFDFIPPSEYLVRVIFDRNSNGIWDTGSFLNKKQPERVAYYPVPIEVRANWEKTETFTLLDR